MVSTTQPDRSILGIESLVRTIAKKEGFQNFKLETKPITTNGANYLGDLYLVDVVETGKETLKLFAKAANTPEHARAMVKANNIYKREVYGYTAIADAYDDLQEKHNIPEHKKFKFPKYYCSNLTDMEEVIIFENLQAEGFVLHDRFKPLDWEYAKAGVEEIAKFHALSFALEKEDSEQFDKLIRKNDALNMNDFDGLGDIISKALPLNIALVDAEHRSKVEKFFYEIKGMNQSNGPISKHSTLVHSDYKMSNILVKYQNNMVSSLISKYTALSNENQRMNKDHHRSTIVQNEENVISSLKLVDYQTLSYGCPLDDLVYFLFTGTDEEFRRLHFEQIIEHYHNSLADHLKLLSRDINDIYPKSTFYFELKDKIMYGLFVGMIILGGILLDPTVDMKLGDVAGPDSILDNISKMTLDNTLYENRMNGIIRDFVRWGLLK